MPTRRSGRGRGRSSRGEGDYKMGESIKNAAKKGIEGYLKATNKLADSVTKTGRTIYNKTVVPVRVNQAKKAVKKSRAADAQVSRAKQRQADGSYDSNNLGHLAEKAFAGTVAETRKKQKNEAMKKLSISLAKGSGVQVPRSNGQTGGRRGRGSRRRGSD